MNKIFLRHFITLAKINIIYIIAFVVSIIIFMIYWFKFQDYLAQKNQLKILTAQVQDLSQKQRIINSFQPSELDSLIKTLNTLLPGKEDYFSIFSTLQKVSDKSGFTITSYTVNFSEATPEKVGLTINGDGSPAELLSFIQNYKFSGGRLITMDNVEFSPSTTKTALKVNFYSKNTVPTNADAMRINAKTFDLIKSINDQYTQSSIQDSGEQAVSEGAYTPKEDPFK